MRLLLVIILLTLASNSKAFDNYPVGARSAGMSNASVVNIDIYSIQNNQGALGFFNKLSLGAHHENKYLTEKFGYKASYFTLPTRTGNFGLSFAYFGDKYYNEKKVGLAYAKSLWEKVSFGLQLDYLHTQFAQQYGNSGAIAAELGMLVFLTENIKMGAHVFNPTKNQVNSLNEIETPTIYKLGIGYSLPELLSVNAEMEKDLANNPFFKIGTEYYIYEDLSFRAGISNQSNFGFNNATDAFISRYSFGIGYVKFNTRADIAFMSHPDLGFTPHFSICYEFK